MQILKVRLETEEELLKEESKIAAIRSERDQAQLKPSREWFFLRWLRPHAIPPMAAIRAEIARALNETRESQGQQAQQFAGTLADLQQALTTITDQLQQVATFKAQLEHIAGVVDGQHEQFRLKAEAITSTVEGLAASLEALKVKSAPRRPDGSGSEASRAKVVKLHPVATGSSERGVNLQASDGLNPGRKARAFLFIAEYQRTHDGAEPTLPEIMQAVGCAQGSASNYRNEYRKRQEAPGSELATVAGVVNE